MKFNSKILLISLLSIFLLLSIATASAADADIAAVDADVDMDEISDIAIKDSHQLFADSDAASDGNATDVTVADTNGTGSNATNASGTSSNATNSSGNNTNNSTKYDGPVTNITIVPVTTVLDYQSGNFTFKVLDNLTGEAIVNQTIKVSGVYFYKFGNGTSLTTSKEFTTDANGMITIPNELMNKDLDTSGLVYNYTALNAGTYNLTFSGNDSLKVVQNATLPITVNTVNAKIQASNLVTEVGSGKRYTFKVVNSATGEALKLVRLQFKIMLNGKNYTTYNATTNLSGEAGFNLNLYGGKYPVTIVDNDSNIKASSVSKNITITKKVGVLSASNRVIYYNSAATAIIKLTDKKTKKPVSGAIIKVRVYITNKKYTDLAFATNSKGQVSFKAALPLGIHKLIISTLDNNYTASSISRYTTLKKTTGKISAYNINTYYKSGKLYTITLKNAKNGNAMYGCKLNIRVYISSNKYYKYEGVTDGNGQVKINTSSLKPGTYRVTVAEADSGFTAKSISKTLKITKVPTKLTSPAVKVKYNSGKYLQTKVTHKTNNKALSGVKLTVKVYTSASKYKTYKITSNAKGIAYFKVTQGVGTYKVVISSANSYYTASAVTTKITVTK